MYKAAVIGAGINGLSCAVELQRKFGAALDITVFTEDLSPNTTGDVSAGLWGPYVLEDTPVADIIKWSKTTQDYMHLMWKTGYAEKYGISLIPVVQLSTEHEPSPDWLPIAIGGKDLDEVQVGKFGRDHGHNYKCGFTYLAFALEPSKYLPCLQESFIRSGGKLVIKKITDLSQLSDFDLIVNCCGLYSKQLIGDSEMQPVRGQVARVRAPWQYHSIFYDSSYIIPNTDCTILGGTKQKGDFDLSARDSERRVILESCGKLVPSMKNAEIVNCKAGLRPARTRVRLEVEKRFLDGKDVCIVHNYGHGGSGVTLFKGCAEDVCELVSLNLYKSKL